MKLKKLFIPILLIINIIISANLAFAQNITVTEDVTITVGGYNYTLLSTSNALDQLEVTSTSIVITTNLSSGTVTIKSADRINLGTPHNTFGIGLTTCQPGESVLIVQANQSLVRTVTITPPDPTATDFLCNIAAVGAGGGGGGGSPGVSIGSGSTNSGTGTDANKESKKIITSQDNSKSDKKTESADLFYYQLPEKNETGIKMVNNKPVKFPATGPNAGKVTKKTLMKNTENKSSYLLQFGAKVKKSDGKPYTGLVMGPKTIGIANNLPGIKLPKGYTILDRTEIQFDEPVKISGKFELKLSLPQSVLKSKNFNPKDKKRFKIYNYNTKSKKWKSAGLALVGKDKKSVYVKTSKYGFFILVDTKK